MAKITQELVNMLADRISARGENPTNQKIREENGNIGSMSTIRPLLKNWRESQLDNSLDSIPDLPVEEIESLFAPIWFKLVKASREEYHTQMQDMEYRAREFQKQEASLEQEVDRQADIIEMLEQQLQELRDVNSTQQNTLIEADIAHTKMLNEIEAKDQTLADNKLLIEKLQALDTSKPEDLENALNKIDDLENKVNDLERDLIRAQSDVETAQVQVTQKQDRIESMLGDNAALKATVSQLEQRLDDFKAMTGAANETAPKKPVKRTPAKRPTKAQEKAKPANQAQA